MLERSQIGIGLSMIILAGLIVVIIYVRLIKTNTDRFNPDHPQSDLNKILEAIEGTRQQLDVEHEEKMSILRFLREKMTLILDRLGFLRK
jgi:hypothetical protein